MILKARGMTLLEAMVAMMVVAVGMLSMASAIICSMVQQDSNRMETLATNWACSKMHELQQNQALTSSFKSVFCTYTGQANASPAVAANDALNHAMRTPKPWNVPNAWGEDLTAYNTTTGLPTAPNAVYIPDPIQNLTANGQVKSLFIGWYYIYFPTDANGNLASNPTQDGTNSFYGNPPAGINLGLMGMGSSSSTNNVDIFGGAAVSNSSYVLLPVTIRVVWQDVHTGDPNNDYLRYVEIHDMLGDTRANDP